MMFAGNAILALLWAMLTGSFTLLNLGVGFAVGFLILVWIGPLRRSSYTYRLISCVKLLAFTIWELVRANLQVAWYTVSDLRGLSPAILAVPLEDGLSDLEITLLSTLITLTPGTLTLELSPDRRRLFVHFIHVREPEVSITQIKNGFEARLLKVTR